jgi:hypothetical protein
MKRANHSTQLGESEKHKKPSQPAAQTGKNEHDAREDAGKLKENRQDLGIADDHKTEDMEREHRGTFP